MIRFISLQTEELQMIIDSPYAKAKEWLKKNNYPFTDYFTLTKSDYSFENGGHYGVEIPVINSFQSLKKTIYWLEHHDVYCDRFNETKGTFLLPRNEIKDMLSLCHEKNVGITFSLSPRPEYEPKAAFYRTAFGLEQGRQINSNEAIAYAIEEAITLSELGCRGLIVYDIGLLNVLYEMRQTGHLPKDLLFKASSHCMVSNPLIAKVFQTHGADSVTMIHDVSLPVLQETRKLCPSLLLDISVDSYADKGGFIRFAEIANLIQVASPIMLKLGASAQCNPYDEINEANIKLRASRVMVALEHVKNMIPDAKRINLDNKFRCIPSMNV